MSVAWELASAACFQGPYVGWWLAELSDSCLTKPGARTRRSSSCPLCSLPFALCRDPGQAGEIGPPCPPCPRAGALSQATLAVQTLSQAVQPGKCTPYLCPTASRLHRAHRLLWWFRKPRHLMCLNQPDTEKRELFTEESSQSKEWATLPVRMTHKAEGGAGVLVTLKGITGTLIHPPSTWMAGTGLAQRLFPPLDSEI